jgi:hypothetical protein
VRRDGVRAATQHALHDAGWTCNSADLDEPSVNFLSRLPIAVALASALLALVACGLAFDWHLGDVGGWLAGLGAISAAIVALRIARQDRTERIAERHEEQKTRARLVQVSVEGGDNSRAAITVQARNFGPLPVIDLDLVDAKWSEHPEARWVPLGSHWVGRGRQASSTHRPILMPSQGLQDTFDTLTYFVICFMHPTEDRPMAPIVPRTANYVHPNYVSPDLSTVVIKLQFTTAWA